MINNAEKPKLLFPLAVGWSNVFSKLVRIMFDDLAAETCVAPVDVRTRFIRASSRNSVIRRFILFNYHFLFLLAIEATE